MYVAVDLLLKQFVATSYKLVNFSGENSCEYCLTVAYLCCAAV